MHRGSRPARGNGRAIGLRKQSQWRCASWVRIHSIEPLEPRIVLSAHLLTPIGYFQANTTGARPFAPLIADAAGNWYGTTTIGGAYGGGTVFEIPKGSNAITTLAPFPRADGSPGLSLTLDAAGNLYGRTTSGGDHGYGIVFEIARGSNTVTTLASFTDDNRRIGLYGGGLTLDPEGNLYGVTGADGTYGDGTVFEIAKGSNSVTILAEFNGTNGEAANATPTLDAAGNLYGTTGDGGAYGRGEVFELAKGSNKISVLASFDGTDGAFPAGGVTLDAEGNLFGTTGGGGGTGNNGTVFEIPAASSSIVTLAPIPLSGDLNPTAVVLDSAGNLYGSLNSSGTSNGSVFEVVKGSNTLTTIASFDGTNGAHPSAIAFDSAGDLVGVTNDGGTNNSGTVFKIPQGSNHITSIASFDVTTGYYGTGTLVADAAGNIYGTTPTGGTYNNGTVYEIVKSTGMMTPLVSFDGADGTHPLDGVIFDSAGNLYGASLSSSASPGGTIYEVPAGSHSILTLATISGVSPNSPLILDSAGNLYGTTANTGTTSAGTVFEVIKGSGVATTIGTFNGVNGDSPTGGLAFDSAGRLVGIARSGSQAMIFSVGSGAGNISTRAAFDASHLPVGGLVADAAGNLYGEASTSSSTTAIFELAANTSTITYLATLSGSPVGNVAIDPAGNIYGVTQSTVFEVPKGSGAATTLARITRDFAADGVIIDAADNVYGVGQTTAFEVSPLSELKTVSLGGQGSGNHLTLIADADQVDVDWTTGTTAGSLPFGDAAGLAINGDGSNDPMTLDYFNGNPLPKTVHLNGTFTLQSVSGAISLNANTIDLSPGSTAYIAYASAATDPLSAIENAIRNGYQGGAWTGTGTATAGAITSQAAATNPGSLAIGFADAADPNSPDALPNTIELKCTVPGDVNLDGTVNLTDLLTLVRNFGSNGTGWDGGDLNYDGAANLSDFLLLARNFGRVVQNPTLASVFAASQAQDKRQANPWTLTRRVR